VTYKGVVALFAGLAALLGAGWLVGLAVTEIDFITERIDRPAVEWLASNRTPFWNGFMRGATRLGSGVALTSATALAATATFLWTRDLRWGGFVLIASLGGTGLDKILKPIVGRERPDFDRLIEIGGNSFPSGHATGITALWLAVALVAYVGAGRRATWVWVLAGLVIGVVCLTRPYLGVHYPTDVVAGAALSSGWVALCALWTGVSSRPREE
jgi:undecaprenyl-diphosphatase